MSAQIQFGWSPVSDPSLMGFVLLTHTHFPIAAFLLIVQIFFSRLLFAFTPCL